MFSALKCLTFFVALSRVSAIVYKPVYQAAIYLKPHQGFSQSGTHICNGVIIHHRLILTTADCMYLDIKPEVVQRVSPQNLYITAGSNSIDLEEVTRDVESYEIPNDFNFDRLENDIAILRLNKSLPLGYRNDMKWIMIDDEFNTTNARAMITFYNRNTKQPNLSKTDVLEILPNSECRDENVFSESRTDDICSIYSLPDKSYCEITRHNLEISADRGSGLICKNSHLVGLLSQIIPPTSESIAKLYCRDIDRVHAFYTLVGKHIMWIYNKLAFEVGLETNDPYYIAAPYTNNELQEYIVQKDSIDDSVQFVSTPSITSLNQIQNETTTSTDFYVIFNFFSNSSRIASNSNFIMIVLSVLLTLFYETR
ncbi:hypothetical protein ACFFRR_005042 [Megaselia abdita]